MRRILLGLILLAASLSTHPFDRNQGSAQAQQIVLPCVPSGNSCIPVSAANPLPTTGGGGGGSPGGSNTQVQYNNSSSFGGTSAITTDGTNATIATGTGTLTVGAGSAITSSGAGGSLGTNAFTSTAYAPLASPTFTGTVTMPDSATWTSSGVVALTALGLTNTAAVTWAGRGILTSPAAATIQYGAADVNGAPVAQTLSFQNALAGSATNQASANTTVIGSLGTGTGTNGDIIFQTGVKTTTGTAQATPTTALTVKGETGRVAVAAVGSAAAPSLSVGNATTGFYSVSTTGFGVSVNGVLKYDYGITNAAVTTITSGATYVSNGAAYILSLGVGSATAIPSTYSFAWTNAGNATSTVDTWLSRSAAASVQMGQADAAAPVAQTLGVQNVVAGTTNTGGANWTINGSKSTGTGVGGSILMQVSKTGSTGSTVNTNYPLLTLIPGSATTATVQFGDGTNFTTYDSCTALTTSATGVIACTASAIRFKELYDPQLLNLAGLDALRTDVPWRYRKDAGHGLDSSRIHVGLFADEVVAMDPRCGVWRDGEIEPSDYEDRCVIDYLVADRKVLKLRLTELERKTAWIDALQPYSPSHSDHMPLVSPAQ